MRTVKATYQRPVYSHGGSWLRDEPVELEAECEQFGDEVLTVWTDACLATLAVADLDMEELVGATEAIEEAFFAAEREAGRLDYLAQRMAPSPPATREQLAFVVLSALDRLSEKGAA